MKSFLTPIDNSVNKKLRISVAVAAGILLIFLYCLIFIFSNQNSEDSGTLSLSLTERIINFADRVFHKNWSVAFKHSVAEYFEHPLRKFAHFAEYFILGTVWFFELKAFFKRSFKMNALITILVFLSAFFDELHQFFIPGRFASIADLLLDTFGCICALLIINSFFHRMAIFCEKKLK